MRIALMCAEKDPIDCHRCILVSPRLLERGLNVVHILADGILESHEVTERRLLELFKLLEPDFFRSDEAILAEAYKTQAEKIAYQEKELSVREEPPSYES